MNRSQPASPHRIRLPAPWRVTHSAHAATSLPATSAATLAVDRALVFCRSFQRPTGLSGQSSIALEVTLLEPLSINITLNGCAVPHQSRSALLCVASLRSDQLQPVNQLEITVQAPADGSAAWRAMAQPQFGRDCISRVELVLD